MSPADISLAEGSAFPWILEHLLQYPGTYEIPLRTMYTNNVLAQTNNYPTTPSLSSSSSSPISPSAAQFPGDANRQSTTTQAATEHFKSCLMEQIAYLPSQPFSLPPAFITSFVRRCFTENLCQVDFTQALTAMDYLKDLETRRKRELSAALQRLGITADTTEQERDDMAKRSPAIAQWISSMEEKERRVEALYTQVYIGLRRWTLINEMRLSPFSKPNCIAMLNTLYPPTAHLPPTPQLTPTILTAQRNAFFRYIQAVERNGRSVLANLENQSRRHDEANGWPVVRDIIDKYLRTANTVVDECVTVTGPENFDGSYATGKSGRRADSGVSFASGDRPSTSTSGGSAGAVNTDKPLPLSPGKGSASTPACPPSTPGKSRGGSTLERIAREIRRIKSNAKSKDDYDYTRPHPASLDKQRSLKKMTSASQLRLGRSMSEKKRSHSRGGSGGRTGEGLLEIDAARRAYLLKEAVAARGKENRPPSRGVLGRFGPGRAELEG